MHILLWLLLAGSAMAALALVGSLTLLLPAAVLDRVISRLVAFAAGSLVGGALFHMIPAALESLAPVTALTFVAGGFLIFFGMEQFLHWHHCHRATAACKQPLTYLILVGDGLHNFLGGLSVGAVFLADVRLGITAWLAAAAHEIPQELGDFGVLVHGGWSRRSALWLNFLSGLMFLAGMLLVYVASKQFDVRWLVPIGAGNFLYIGASDLVPEVNKPHSFRAGLAHFASFAAGLALLLTLRFVGID